MSGNFKQAIAVINKEQSSMSLINRIKHQIKVACVYKKASFYNKAYDVLQTLESELDQALG